MDDDGHGQMIDTIVKLLQFVKDLASGSKINIKKIALGNKEHTITSFHYQKFESVQ